MKFTLIACITAAVLFAYIEGETETRKYRLGDNVVMMLGSDVKKVKIVPGSSILNDGNLTMYGRLKYRGRLTFDEGELTIVGMTAKDAVTYVYTNEDGETNEIKLELAD